MALMPSGSLKREYNWFKREDYLPISSFNLADWAAMLQVRRNFEHASAPDRKHHLAPDAAKELTITVGEKSRLRTIWDDYLRVALPSNHRKVRPGAAPAANPFLAVDMPSAGGAPVDVDMRLAAMQFQGLEQPRMLPLLEDITEQIAGLDKDEASAWAIHFGVRFLRVNRIVPNKDLKQAFDRWLRKSRIRAPRRMSRRRRPSSNVIITSRRLKSWTAYNILGVMDLDLCATLFGVRRLSHQELCDYLIDPKRLGKVDPKDWGRTARIKAEEAKQSLLIAQVSRAPADKDRSGTN
jgi:hypothetical protein